MALLALAAFVIVGGIAYLIYRSSGTVLDFIRVLAWPTVVIVLILVFRRPLANMLERIDLRWFKTPFGEAGFEPRQQEAGELDLDELEDLELFDEFVAEEEHESLQEQLARHRIAAEMAVLLGQTYDSQLGLLRLLNAAPSGAPRSTVQNYFDEITKQYPALMSWGIENFLAFLFTNELIFINDQGGYRITPKGSVLAGFSEIVFHAPKIL